MRLARTLASLWAARLSRWDRTWKADASIIDNAALAALVAWTVYSLLVWVG